MNIIYTKHLKDRLKERRFPKNYPEKIFLESEEKYIDTIQNSNIAIKKLSYNGKIRKIMVAYTFNAKNVRIHTIHPENNREIKKRIKSGRWIKI